MGRATTTAPRAARSRPDGPPMGGARRRRSRRQVAPGLGQSPRSARVGRDRRRGRRPLCILRAGAPRGGSPGSAGKPFSRGNPPPSANGLVTEPFSRGDGPPSTNGLVYEPFCLGNPSPQANGLRPGAGSASPDVSSRSSRVPARSARPRSSGTRSRHVVCRSSTRLQTGHLPRRLAGSTANGTPQRWPRAKGRTARCWRSTKCRRSPVGRRP